MKTKRLTVLSCGYACACAMQAAQAESPGDGGAPAPADAPAPGALAERLADADAATPQPLAGYVPEEASDGLHVQFDSGTIENVRRIVGFWPSVHWLNSRNRSSTMAALGYTWRNLRLEGALFKERDTEPSRNGNNELLRLDSIKKRLSYTFGPHWAFQLSRGYLNAPDQFRPDQKSRRRTASLTYRSTFAGNPWHATLAYGRGRGLSGETSNAYLFDTAMQVGPSHTVFGRVERAGHDELFREEDGPRNRVYEASKMSIGYLYEVKNEGIAKVDIGGMISRRLVPNELLPYYGDKNTSYTVFVRMQMKFN